MQVDHLWKMPDLLHFNIEAIEMTSSTMIAAHVQGQETNDTAHPLEDEHPLMV
jgi:hypothetical protein